MSTPIIILAGEAGSGKDTVGAYLAQSYNAVTIALADPMKRFARDVFGFSVESLWGPSEARNVEVVFSAEEIARTHARFHEESDPFVRSLLPDRTEVVAEVVRLINWLERIMVGVERDGKVSPRHVLQQLGSQWGRCVNKNMWTDYVLRTARTLLSGDTFYSREFGLVEAEGTSFDYVAITDGRFRNEIVGTTMVGGVSLLVKRGNARKLAGATGTHKSELELGGIPRHFFTDVLKNDRDFSYLYSQVDDAMAINFGDTRIVDAFVEKSESPNLQ